MRASQDPVPRTTRARGLLRELSTFGTVGALAVLLDLALFQLLYAGLGVGAVAAKLVSAVTTACVAYAAHRSWTFAGRARTGARRELPAFLVVTAGTLPLSLGIVALVRHPLGQTDPLVLQGANLAAIAVGTVVRYLAYRRWVFLAPVAPGRA